MAATLISAHAASGQVSLDRALDNAPVESGRPQVTVHVLTAEGGRPLPGVRVIFENVATGNRGSRVSGSSGACKPFYVPSGTRLEITATSDRYYFGEAGADGVVRTSYFWDGREDRTIYFKGSDHVVVPELAGMRYEEARSAVERSGLRWTYTRADPCPGNVSFTGLERCRNRIDRVLEQSPAAGRRVRAYGDVSARVGAWPPPREVPQVSFGFERPGTALSAREACHRLQRAGFLTRVANVLQRGCRGGGVMRQNPDGGTQAAYGSVVEIVLCSDGPHDVAIGQDLVCTPRAPAP